MSLTLKESCTLYERFCRRNKNIPTFEEFNQKHFTCLPNDKVVFKDFKASIITAKRAEGLPIRRKLPSLFKRFHVSDNEEYEEEDVHVAEPQKAFVSHLAPSYENGLRMNIRHNANIQNSIEQESSVPDSATETETEVEADLAWSLEAYKKELSESTNPKLKESNGMMIHFVPPTRCAPLEALACKFTKKCYETLQGKENHPLKMRDNSIWAAGANWNQDDVTAVLQMRKKKTAGPYFIRVSGI